MSNSSDASTEKKVGNVKWFNNKAGYGFITMDEKTDNPLDVFAHYSNINVSNSQYKYLVLGEYVEFVLTPTPDGPHAFQATNITGIGGGPTLCERRRLTRDSVLEDGDESAPVRRQPRSRPSVDEERPRPPRTARGSTGRRPVPVQDVEDSEGFTTVRKKRSPAQK
jgi:cold shock CspA family protein